jgi:chain length determinant protein (polysaccharide antigen chain regulator)
MLNQQLSIRVAEPQSSGASTVSWQGQDPNKIAAWLNQYVAMARTAAHDQLSTKLKGAVEMRVEEIDRQIEGLRVIAAAERQRNVRNLQDALKIAQTLQLTKPLSAGNLVASYTGSAAYLRGSDALQAEIGLLKARTNDDAYIPQLPELLYAKHLLQTARISPEPLSVASIEQQALPPMSPVQPRKKLTIVLGIFLGLMIGILAALVRRKIAAN